MSKEREGNVGSGCAWMVVFAIVLISIARCAEGTDAPSAVEGFETAYVTASALNCRASAGTTAAIVETIQYRSLVFITHEDEEWSRLDRSEACWVSSQFLSSSEPPLATPTSTPQPLLSSRQASPQPARSCGAAPYCTEISSCAEAQFYYRECGIGRLDGDNDGVPCEKLCR